MASSSFPFLALPPPGRDSPSFWTICPFCHYAHEYLRKYEKLDLWCQICGRAFRAIPMACAPLVVPGTQSYYFGPFGYGGYYSASPGTPWWPFCPPLPLPMEPYGPPKSAHVTPPEHQIPSTTNRQPHNPLPVSEANGVDSSHKLVSSTKIRSGEIEVSSRKRDHVVNKDQVRTETRITRSRSERVATRTRSRVHKYAIRTEPKIRRSRSSSVCQLVHQHAGQLSSSTKALAIQGNLPEKTRTLLVKKAKMEVLKNLPEHLEMERKLVPTGNVLARSLATTTASITTRAQNRRKDRVEQKISNLNFLKSKKTHKGSKGIKSAVSEKKEASNYKTHCGDPGEGELRELFHEGCEDIVPLEKFDGSVSTSLIIEIPDSDFYNFDDNRNESTFEEGHIWAIYDEADGMPRIYARIQKVISRKPFFVLLNWLQSVTGMNNSCGQFKIGRGTSCDVLNLFSHRVTWDISPFTGDIRIHPKKNEVWAVSYVATEHASLHQIVEILNEYTEEHGVSLISLARVSGFKCVYQKLHEGLGGFASTWSLSKEDLHKFSHQIPAIKIAEDIPDVPGDCWELDPAAIPNCLLGA
ncbi:uncharacterized protein LOC116258388 [Nymphaea colorata]|uniref:uncharacterized protein LOC116258388 n=1 Tax=Nymphaea colorata TaxID=210225 RepID=UPI00129E48BB|nr:uncharacterized protein LOC116258388 [Nymphaea colorata]